MAPARILRACGKQHVFIRRFYTEAIESPYDRSSAVGYYGDIAGARKHAHLCRVPQRILTAMLRPSQKLYNVMDAKSRGATSLLFD